MPVQQFRLVPTIHLFEKCKEFVSAFEIGEGDVVLTSALLYNSYFSQLDLKARVLLRGHYGSGEPNDAMAEAILADLESGPPCKRVVAIGGGAVLDLAKLMVLKEATPVADLFDGHIQMEKVRQLVLVPTTCGSGSEVTGLSILELGGRGTKMGLAGDALYADAAVLIPELLEGLPYRAFVLSSIDALVHAMESAVSPGSSAYTRMFSYQAIELLLGGYREIEKHGQAARVALLKDFLTAANFAGIAFAGAGCGAVHAMGYPLGGSYHISHGEASYVLFTRIFETYQSISGQGLMAPLNALLARLLGCNAAEVYQKLAGLLVAILPRPRLSALGVAEGDIPALVERVAARQQHLLKSSYVPLSSEAMAGIYQSLL